MAQTATQFMSTETGQEPIPIQHVETVEVRKKGINEYRVTVTQGVKTAGLGDGATFQFKPREYDELGVIPALGTAADEDAPRDRNTRTATGDGKSSVRIALPKDVIDVLERVTNDDQPVLLDVFAGDRVIAIAPAEGIDIPVEALPQDPDRVVDSDVERDHLRLEAVQNARPRVKVGTDGQRMVELTATRAIRAAGLTSTVAKPYSVSYHPETAADFGGLVPAVGYRRGAGVGDPAYSIYREQGGGSDDQPEVYSLGLPTEVLDVLGISVHELEDLDRSERPAVTVYAVEGLLGFNTPTVRQVAVDRERTGELTDVEGIGEAVAARLRERGYESPEDLAGIAREELLDIQGVSTGRADRILSDLSDHHRGQRVDEDQTGSAADPGE